MTNRSAILAYIIAAVALSLAGCGSGGASFTGPPEGWETADGRWWRSGTDTAAAFRDLSTLQAMGVVEGARTYAVTGTQVTTEQLGRALQEELVALYRHAPEVIDSLFTRYVVPGLGRGAATGKVVMDELKAEGYETIRAHFREPRQALTLGEEVPIVYPDSLKQQGVSGQVQTQVYVNAEGEPQAVKLVEGVHPTLNAIALHAATQMRWEPAYVEVDGAWEPIPSWVRFGVYFRQPPG